MNFFSFLSASGDCVQHPMKMYQLCEPEKFATKRKSRNIHVYVFRSKMARSARGMQYRKIGRLRKQGVKKTSALRTALALRRVQENLLSQREGSSSEIGKSSSTKKKKSPPALNLKENRIVNIGHFGRS